MAHTDWHDLNPNQGWPKKCTLLTRYLIDGWLVIFFFKSTTLIRLLDFLFEWIRVFFKKKLSALKSIRNMPFFYGLLFRSKYFNNLSIYPEYIDIFVVVCAHIPIKKKVFTIWCHVGTRLPTISIYFVSQVNSLTP